MVPPLRPPILLRAALLVGLGALLLTGLRRDDPRPPALRLAGDTDTDGQLASALVQARPPAAVLWAAGDPPAETEIDALADLARRTPLFVERTGREPGLRVVPPDAPRVDRYAAVRFQTTGRPGDTVTARLLDPEGAVLDSARLAAHPSGTLSGGFRVRPGRAGWTEWRVRVGPEDGRAGVWVAPAEPPRVLIIAGPPSWETRFVARSLERAGAAVALVQDLGRDNVITSGGAPRDWATVRDLAAYDVVVLLPGVEADTESLAALDTWVATGKGILAAPPAAADLGLAPRPGSEDDGAWQERPVRGDSLVWSAPAEIAALPSAELEATLGGPASAPPGSSVAARAPDGEPVLVLAPMGAGRGAVLTLRDSWRWVMDAGLEAEHRAFWRSLVDWLAVPSADSLGLTVVPSEAAVGATVDLAARGSAFRVTRPDGTVDALSGATGGADGSGVVVARFVAVDTGVHRVNAGMGPDAADATALDAFRARPREVEPAAELGRARLALLAAASGGATLEPDSFAAAGRALGGGDRPGRWLPWVFGLLALLALAEWTLRRRGGLP